MSEIKSNYVIRCDTASEYTSDDSQSPASLFPLLPPEMLFSASSDTQDRGLESLCPRWAMACFACWVNFSSSPSSTFRFFNHWSNFNFFQPKMSAAYLYTKPAFVCECVFVFFNISSVYILDTKLLWAMIILFSYKKFFRWFRVTPLLLNTLLFFLSRFTFPVTLPPPPPLILIFWSSACSFRFSFFLWSQLHQCIERSSLSISHALITSHRTWARIAIIWWWRCWWWPWWW